jgi:hypothetical protein
MGENAQRRTYPIKSLDILIDAYLENLDERVSISARIHTRERAIASVRVNIRRWTERGSRKERYIRGRTGLGRVGKEGRGDGVEEDVSARKQEIRRTS